MTAGVWHTCTDQTVGGSVLVPVMYQDSSCCCDVMASSPHLLSDGRQVDGLGGRVASVVADLLVAAQ